ncbi:MAG: hypothetical protein QM662_11565 [Gordonia sp. (in: high G+C Gram-positive bacteria)]
MNPPADWGTVTVDADADGLITITPDDLTDPPTPITTASLTVIGGVLMTDITRPGAAPRALIVDAWPAEAWLEPVYGTAVADAVAEIAAEIDADAAAGHRRVPAGPGDLAPLVDRLGIGYWLHRWWPTGVERIPELNTAALEIEIGALGWLAEALFVDTDPLIRLLEPHTETLVALVNATRSATGEPAERDLGVLTTALRATTDLVPESTPGYQAADALLAQILAENAVVAEAMDTVDWGTATTELAAAVAAAGRKAHRTVAIAKSSPVTDHAIRVGRTTLDWLQVPPRAVDARDDNVKWAITLDDDNNASLTVHVAGAPYREPADGTALFARAYRTDDPLSFPEIFELPYDRDLRGFLGRQALPEVPAAGILIDVFDPAYSQPPRLSEAAAREAAEERRQIIEIITGRRTNPTTTGVFVAERAAWEDSNE